MLLITTSCNKYFSNTTDAYVYSDNTFILKDNTLAYSKKINTYFFHLDVNRTKGEIKSFLKVYLNTDKKFVCDLDFNVDVQQKHFKFFQSDNIISKAKTLSDKFDFNQNQLQIIAHELDVYFDSLKTKINNNYNVLLSNSVPYFISTITTLLRKKESSSFCECTTHPAYLVEKSYFICMEDNILDTKNLQQIANSKEFIDSFRNNKKAMEFADYINGLRNDSVSGVEILEHYMPKKIYTQCLNILRNLNSSVFYDSNDIVTSKKHLTILTKHKIPQSINAGFSFLTLLDPIVEPVAVQLVKDNFNGIPEAQEFVNNLESKFDGRSWGCCGSYDGFCYYANVFCYFHDKVCRNCKPKWLCGWKCKPDYR